MEFLGLLRPNVRRMAAKRQVSGLIRALAYERDYRIRQGAARFLGRTGDPRALDPLTRALQDTHPMVRAAAAEALGVFGDPRAIESLIVALMDAEWAVHAAAVKSLKRIGGFRALLLLVDVLAHGKDDRFRATASDVLVELDDERAVDPLVRVFRERSVEARIAAADTLGRMRAGNAVGHLIPLLDDPDAEVRRHAFRALRKISGRDLDGIPNLWWEWWVQTVIESSMISAAPQGESRSRRPVPGDRGLSVRTPRERAIPLSPSSPVPADPVA